MSKIVTPIDQLDESKNESSDIDIDTLDDNNLSKIIVDLSVSEDVRLKAINLFFKNNGVEQTIEITSRLGMMYQMSGLHSLQKYLYNICVNSELHAVLKADIIKNMCSYDMKSEIGFKALNILFPNIKNDIPVPVKIELVVLLMNHKDFKTQARDYFCDIINDDSIDVEYRFKSIYRLEHLIESKEDISYFIREASLEFFNNVKNPTRYRVIAGQYVLIEKVEQEYIEKTLLEFANDSELDYNIRADATDVVLKLGSDSNKDIAQEIIMSLGITSRIQNVFSNAQNVHDEEIEESVKEIIEFLNQFDIMSVNDCPITFEYVEKQICKVLEKERKELNLQEDDKYEREDKIRLSLNRIYMDRGLYSSYNCNLKTILLRVWTYINGHKHEEEMKTRLYQELEEMSGTCSSGYASRLCNTISGFGDMSIRISWRDQIIANVFGRLNARARELDDLDFQEKVIVEMTLDTSDYNARRHFLEFFRDNILSIRDEMHEEFTKHLDDTTFDLYFRSAISTYECGDWV